MARAGIVHPTALSMLGFGLAWTCKGFVNAVITIICVVVQLYLEDIFIQLSPSGSYSLPNTLWKRECNISYPILSYPSIYLSINLSTYLPTHISILQNEYGLKRLQQNSRGFQRGLIEMHLTIQWTQHESWEGDATEAIGESGLRAKMKDGI